MQVDGIKTRVESAAWFQRLKLKYDDLLSSFAFKFNLRHYIQAPAFLRSCGAALRPGGVVVCNLYNGAPGTRNRRSAEAFAADLAAHVGPVVTLGRAVQVDPIKPALKAPGTYRLKLKCHRPLSDFAVEFNLRRYTSACRPAMGRTWYWWRGWGLPDQTLLVTSPTRIFNPRLI